MTNRLKRHAMRKTVVTDFGSKVEIPVLFFCACAMKNMAKTQAILENGKDTDTVTAED